MTRLALILPVALLAALAAPSARGAETAPALRLEHLDLLPLGEFERQDLVAAHPEEARRLQGLASRVRSLEAKLAKLDRKDEKARTATAAEIGRLRAEAAELLAALRESLRENGLTDAMIERMGSAPEGRDRVERYSHSLVLLLEDLDPDQRAIFERVVPEVDGAYLAAQAIQDRAKLALDQTGLEARQVNGVLGAFRRQTQIIESRFWRLVDYVLDDDQKAALWEMLPTRVRRHASAEDHVYALPGLTPSQGARVKALVTEVEAESAPDQALVARTREALRDKTLSREERAALAKEQREAYARLNALRRFAYETTKEILTPAQIEAMKAIPPRVSSNDRRRDGRRVLQGMTFTAAQEAKLARIRVEGREAARRYRSRMQAIRKEGAEVGPDSPQQMMMQMMMAGVQGEALATQRLLLGRVFREVLTPDQVSGWVMGLYGDRR